MSKSLPLSGSHPSSVQRAEFLGLLRSLQALPRMGPPCGTDQTTTVAFTAAIFQEGVKCQTPCTCLASGPIFRAQRGEVTRQACTANWRQSWDSNPGPLFPEPAFLPLCCPLPCTVTSHPPSALFSPSSFPLPPPSCLCLPYQAPTPASNPAWRCQSRSHPLAGKMLWATALALPAQWQPCPPQGLSGLQQVAAEKP